VIDPTPIVRKHEGIYVVRDDLYLGGTKARYLARLFAEPGVDELVYASPAEGGAQTALAHCAAAAGKRATIFVAKRAEPHPRARLAKRLGATVVQIAPGYLSVVQAKAKAYCAETGAKLVPFGADLPEAIEDIAAAALSIGVQPDEFWCASGSGVLARGLAAAWPNADRHVVQVGRKLEPDDVAGAHIHVHPLDFGQRPKARAPFPSDPHYDEKAWEICRDLANRDGRTVVFWNVTGPA
jgi:hypothetical protein